MQEVTKRCHLVCLAHGVCQMDKVAFRSCCGARSEVMYSSAGAVVVRKGKDIYIEQEDINIMRLCSEVE